MKSKKKKNKRKAGIILSLIQAVLTIIFIIGLFVLGLIPYKYLIPIIVVLILLWFIPFLNQLLCKKRVVPGRILSVLMSIILVTGMGYILKTHGMLASITGGDKKVDNMVVAVLSDNRAKKIEDAEDYRFGVQLNVKSDDTQEIIDDINDRLATKIDTASYNNINEQVKALYNEDVEAIIYNSAYTSIIEESYPTFEDDIRIIYSHDIISALDNSLEVTVNITEPFTVYLSGIDVEGEIDTTGRSDVNIIAIVNPGTHQLLLVTTPRDYYVVLPGISNGMPDKLTHAGIYGVDASMDALSYLYDEEIDYYARVNFTSLPQMVDALGGVDVESEYEFETHPDSGKVMYVNEGINHFNGEQALVFARERQNVPGGDFQRGKDQQALITAMMKKAVSPAILRGAFDIIDSVSKNVDTNIPIKFIQNLIRNQIANPSAWQITSMAADGVPTSGVCFSSGDIELSICEPDYESISEIQYAIDQVMQGIPLEGALVIKDGETVDTSESSESSESEVSQ